VIGDVHVGTGWDDQVSELFPSGLRHPVWEVFVDSCGPGLRVNKAGKVFLDLEETPEFDVDEDAAVDFIQFLAEEKIEHYHSPDTLDWTIGAMTYLEIGTVTLATGQSSGIDSMIRRSQWLQRHGLHGHQTAEGLRARCCSLVETQAELFA
jgi:DNA sulfur modification protein DndC